MASDTTSSDWGAFSVASANGNLGLGVRGTVYAVRNFTNGDRFLFLLGDLGFGFSLGARVNPIIRNLAKTVLSDKNFDNPGSYTRIKANKSFSASDLNLAPGAEATIGVTATVVGISATTISAWPFFQSQHKPNEEVNEDFFTGAVIYSTNDIGMSVSAAYQFLGRWVKLWSF